MDGKTIAFLGTGKSGLGHIRRIASVVRALRKIAPQVRAVLISNAQPGGISETDKSAFAEFIRAERQDMAKVVASRRFDLAVIDTMRLPGAVASPCPALLLLRETPDARLEDFRRDDGKPWDQIIVPNPAAHWLPSVDYRFARSVKAVGWISRHTGERQPGDENAGIVVATGGGGTPESRALLYPLLDKVIAAARLKVGLPFKVRQALGPRSGEAALAEADEVFDPGSALDQVFRAADLVISTAGYNSVLELAGTDTPALLAGIPRSLDDQMARVRLWGPRLGHALEPDDPEAAAKWLAGKIADPCRRPPFDLGLDGAQSAGELIMSHL